MSHPTNYHRIQILAMAALAVCASAATWSASAVAKPIDQVGPASLPASSPSPSATARPEVLANADNQQPSPTASTLPHGAAYSSTQVNTPATPSQVRVAPVASNPGFDWGDAGIGAGAAFALTMIGLGGLLVLSNRRHHHGQSATTA